MRFESLTEALDAAAESPATITFVDSADEQTTWLPSELRARALALLGRLQQHGVARGHEVIVHVTDNRAFLEVFWACLLGGIVPVPIALGISDEHRLKLIRIYAKLENPTLYSETKTLERLESFSAESETDDVFERMRAGAVLADQDVAAPAGAAHRVRPDDVAFIQFSSGSTSEPKGVMLSHRNVMTNVEAILDGLRITPADKGLSWMPLSHDMGLIGFHLTPIMGAVDHVLIPTELFVRRPLIWMQKVAETGATVLCSPNFGYKHFLKALQRRDPGPLDLSRVRLVFNGAEPISVGLCKQFLDQMAPYGLRASTMFPVYGLAEATVAVSFSEPETGLHVVHVDRGSIGIGQTVKLVAADDAEQAAAIPFATLGRAVQDCALRITGGDGAALPENTVGHVEIRGGNVTLGYYRDPKATREIMRGDWIDTGDLGFVGEQGLVVTGRHKDIIFANGQNFFPHDLEEIIQRETGIELGKVAVAGHRAPDAEADDLLVFVVHKGDLDGFASGVGTIVAVLNAQVGIDITHVIPVTNLPKTTSGKVQRHKLIEAYVAGEFAAALAELDALREPAVSASGETAADAAAGSDVQHTLCAICAEILPDRNVGPDDNLFEIGTSSVELAQIHEHIEKAFPGIVDITDLFDYPTIAELTKLLEGKLEAD